MFIYQLKLAVLSLRRNPILSCLLVSAIAVGVAMSTGTLAVYTLYARNPIPAKSDVLFRVLVDNWQAEEPFRRDKPERPPDQMSYRDVVGLMESDIPSRQSGMFKALLVVQPEAEGERPYRALTRMCFSDFFSMFNVPFAYGGGWDRRADDGLEPVAVLDAKTNRRLFAGANSVGKSVKIEDRSFTVVGVLEAWRPTPRFYDPRGGGASREPAGIFLPLGFNRVFELDSAGTTMCPGPFDGGYEGFLASECVWLQMWVQLDSDSQRQAYIGFLDAYALEQKKLGRFPRPLNNRLYSVMEWLRNQEVVRPETKTLLVVSVLFLFVCSVNLIGILLGKFLARAPEVGVRRALGASKLWVFTQHLLECEVVGIIGGVLGLGLSMLLLRFVNQALHNGDLFHIDGPMVVAALLLSMVAGLIAGLFPAWRICRVAPASHLKLQ